MFIRYKNTFYIGLGMVLIPVAVAIGWFFNIISYENINQFLIFGSLICQFILGILFIMFSISPDSELG